MGTRFIASTECAWHDKYKQAVVDADAVISIDMNLPNIPAMRAVRNAFSESVARGEAEHKPNPYAGEAMKLFYEGRKDRSRTGRLRRKRCADRHGEARSADHSGHGDRVLGRDRTTVGIARFATLRPDAEHSADASWKHPRTVMAIARIIVGGLAIVSAARLLVALIAVATNSYLDETNGSLVSSGTTREYLLYLPASDDRTKATPLVISMHAGATWPAQQKNLSHWNRLADQHGFIVVSDSSQI